MEDKLKNLTLMIDGYKNLVNYFEKLFDKAFNNLVFMMKQIPSLLKLKSYKSVYSLVSNLYPMKN